MALQYKAYLYEGKPYKFKEIRRFTVDNDVCSSYEYLRTKVTSIFPNLQADFSLQWKDSDGDMIWFNSDEELLQALSQHSPGDIFKLFIKEQANRSTGKKEKECSGSYSQFPDWRGAFGPFNTQFNPNNCHRFPWSGQTSSSGWNPGFATSGCPMRNSGFEQTESASQEQQQQEPPQSQQDGGMKYLKHMGNAVANFLQPFGVDVDINVEHKGERSKCTGTTQPGTPPNSTPEPQKQQPPAPCSQTNESTPEKEERGSSSDPEWTFVKPDDGNNYTQPKSTDAAMETEEEALLRTTMNQLAAMGFSESDWLIRLTKECDCDIGKILDALQPSGRNYKV